MEEAEKNDKEKKMGSKGNEGGENEERVSEGEGGERVGEKEQEGDEGDDAESTGEGKERKEVDEEDVAGNEVGNIGSGQGDEEVVEGEIPTDVEGEISVDTRKVVNEEEIIGEDDGENVENEEPVDESVTKPEGKGLKEVVDLEVGPDGEDTPVDERMARRNTRRSRQVDELVEATRPRKLQFGTPRARWKQWRMTPRPRRIRRKHRRSLLRPWRALCRGAEAQEKA